MESPKASTRDLRSRLPRSMGSKWLAFAAALVAAFALVPATGAEARKKTCTARGAKTLFQTRLLRVFAIEKPSNTGAATTKEYACYRKTGRKTKIGNTTGPEQVYTYKPAGRLLPVLNSTPVRWSARLLDVKSGKLKFSFSILNKNGSAAALVATPSGGLAFILDVDTPEGESSADRFVLGHKAGTGKHAYTKLTTAHPVSANTDLTRKGDVVSWRIRDESTLPISYITGSANLGR